MKTSPKDKESRKFRFPKGIRQVNIPNLPPFGWDDEALKMIAKTLKSYKGFPRDTKVRFEYRFQGHRGISEVIIYK